MPSLILSFLSPPTYNQTPSPWFYLLHISKNASTHPVTSLIQTTTLSPLDDLVHSDRYLKSTTDWVAEKQQSFFHMVLEARKSQVKLWEDRVSGESPRPGLYMATSSVSPDMAEGTRQPSGPSFIRALILFMKAPLSWPASKYHHFGD